MSHDENSLQSFASLPLKPNGQKKNMVARDRNPSDPAISRHVVHLEFDDGFFQSLTLWPDQ
jgi:hypothetical protein